MAWYTGNNIGAGKADEAHLAMEALKKVVSPVLMADNAWSKRLNSFTDSAVESKNWALDRFEQMGAKPYRGGEKDPNFVGNSTITPKDEKALRRAIDNNK